MTDRELLELAAKAAGLRYIKPSADYSGALGLALCDEYGRIDRDWSPLTDDGDALRLAVKVLNWPHGGRAFSDQVTAMFAVNKLPHDPYAATRRAIVRAAAEIGKATP